MPSGVELAMTINLNVAQSLFETGDFLQRLLELRFNPNNTDEVLHAILQLLMQGIRVFVAFGFEGSEERARVTFDLIIVDERITGERLHVLSRIQPGAAPEDQEVRQGVAAEAIGAVKSGRDFARGEQAGNRSGGGIRGNPNAAPPIMEVGADPPRVV